jgi:hypothetical protein
MSAEMLAAGSTLIAAAATMRRSHASVTWYAGRLKCWDCRSISSGLVAAGTSMANFVAVLAARTAALGAASRASGFGGVGLTGYDAAGVHMCVARALDMAGLGSDAVRPCDSAAWMGLMGIGGVCIDDFALLQGCQQMFGRLQIRRVEAFRKRLECRLQNGLGASSLAASGPQRG